MSKHKISQKKQTPPEEPKVSTSRVPQRPKLKNPINLKQYDWTEKQKYILSLDFDLLILSGVSGTSKAQPLDSTVYTPYGPAMMGDIKEGQYVLTKDGTKTKVIGVFPQGEKTVYKVTFSDGSSTECCGDHLWLTQTSQERNNRVRKDKKVYKSPKNAKVRTTSEIIESVISPRGDRLNHSIPICDPVEFQKKELPIDPYILGCLIGDGGLSKPTPIISTGDDEILDSFLELLPDYKLSKSGEYDYRISYPLVKGENPLGSSIINLGLNTTSEYKFIPEIYKYSSIEDRISILQGLMDTDGSVNRNGIPLFSTCSKSLSDDIREIIQSLGGIVKTTVQKAGYRSKKTGEYIPCKNAMISHINLPNEIIPFRLTRKIEKIVKRTKYFPIRYIQNIEEIGVKECQCIRVEDPSHLYLTDDFIVTHNTSLAVWLALNALNQKKVSDILYIRSAVENSDNALGFLKGDLEQKFSVYGVPFYEKVEELVNKPDIDRLNAENRLDVQPINFIRGHNWNARFVILDEAQNTPYRDLKTFLTRVGKFSKVVICADPEQTDLKKKTGAGGFERMVKNLLDFNEEKGLDAPTDEELGEHRIFHVEFDEEDIVRSEFVKFIVKRL